MDRGRLVYATGDGLKIGDIEDPGILMAIPADSIERMEIIPVARDSITDLETHLEVAALRMGDEFLGTANIAITIGRVLQKLAIRIEVTARRLNRAMGLDHQESGLGAIEIEAKGSAARNHNIVALVIGQQTEISLQHTMAVVDK